MGFRNCEMIMRQGHCEFARQTKHGLHTQREIRAIQKAGIFPSSKGTHIIQVLIPSGRAHHHSRPIREAGTHVGNSRLRRREVNHGIKTGKKRGSQSRGIPVFFFSYHPDTMTMLSSDICNNTPGFPATQHQKKHGYLTVVSAAALLRASTSKTSGSGSSKNSA